MTAHATDHVLILPYLTLNIEPRGILHSRAMECAERNMDGWLTIHFPSQGKALSIGPWRKQERERKREWE